MRKLNDLTRSELLMVLEVNPMLELDMIEMVEESIDSCFYTDKEIALGKEQLVKECFIANLDNYRDNHVVNEDYVMFEEIQVIKYKNYNEITR